MISLVVRDMSLSLVLAHVIIKSGLNRKSFLDVLKKGMQVNSYLLSTQSNYRPISRLLMSVRSVQEFPFGS